MNDDEEEMKELERRMSAKLFGSGGAKTTTVETKRRKPIKAVPVVEVEAKPIPLEQGGDDAFVFVFRAVTPDGKRIHLKALKGDASNDPEVTIREYEAEGRVVRWVGKKPEEYFDDE